MKRNFLKKVSCVAAISYCPDGDYLTEQDVPALCARLENSQVLANLETLLLYLPDPQRTDILRLIHSHLAFFSDVPSRTTELQHVTDVGDSAPIKQHPFCLNPLKRVLMQKEVEYLLENGLTVPSTSAWSSPSVGTKT